MCPFGVSDGTEVDVLVTSSSSAGVWSKGFVSFTGVGSKSIGKIWDGKVNVSNGGGGNDLSSCVILGSASSSRSGWSSDSAGDGLGSGVEGCGGREFFKLISLRTSVMVFLSSFSLLLRDGLCFIAMLRSSFSRSSFS